MGAKGKIENVGTLGFVEGFWHHFAMGPTISSISRFWTCSQWGLFAWSDTVSVTIFTAEHPKLMKLQVRFIQQEDLDGVTNNIYVCHTGS